MQMTANTRPPMFKPDTTTVTGKLISAISDSGMPSIGV